MGIGLIAITTSQKRESGPPFSATSAINGTSVNATGQIVLGNDSGDPLVPAALLSDREIPVNTVGAGGPFNVILTDKITGETTSMSAATRTVSGAVGTSFSDFFTINGDTLRLSMTGAGSVTWGTGVFGLVNALQLVTQGANLGKWQIGTPINTKNNAGLQVNGGITEQKFFRGVSTGAVNIDRNVDSGTMFANVNATGPVTLNCPNMAFANTAGFHFYVCIDNALGITVQLFPGQTVNMGGVLSSAGGTISSTQVGAFLHIFVTTSLRWYIGNFTGAWVIT